MRKSSTMVSVEGITEWFVEVLTQVNSDAEDPDIAQEARTSRRVLAAVSKEYVEALADAEKFLDEHPPRL